MNKKSSEDILDVTNDEEKYYHEKLMYLIKHSDRLVTDALWKRAIEEEMPLIYTSGSSKNFFIAYLIAEKCKRDNKSFSIARTGVNLVVTYLLGISKIDYSELLDASEALPYEVCLGTMEDPKKYSFDFFFGSKKYRKEIIDYLTDKFKLVSNRQNYLFFYDGKYSANDGYLFLVPKYMDLTYFGSHYIKTGKLSGIEYFRGICQHFYISSVSLMVSMVQRDIDRLAKKLNIENVYALNGLFDGQIELSKEDIDNLCKDIHIKPDCVDTLEELINKTCRSYDVFLDGANKRIINKETLWNYLKKHVDSKDLYKVYKVASSHNLCTRKELKSVYKLNKLSLYDEILNLNYQSEAGSAIEIVRRVLLKNYLQKLSNYKDIKEVVAS